MSPTNPELARVGVMAKLLSRPTPAVGSTPHDVVHEENKWRLLRFRSPIPARSKVPVLLVPSLINRWYVLDLMPGKSFVEHLLGEGYDVFCIDWGTPGDEDRLLSFDAIVDGYLGRALRRTCAIAGAERAHVLGYCMGGTMAILHAALRPERFASLVAVAAPVRFHDDGLLSTWVRSPAFDVGALVDACGNLPWTLMQVAFQLLRPTLAISKLVHLAQKTKDPDHVDGFLALETWGSDAVSFPGAAYRRYVDGLYRDDALLKGEFSVSGRVVHLADVRAPTMAVTFEHDNIVPWESARVLLDHVGASSKEHLHVPGGHVGAMVSRGAKKHVWPKIAAFFRAREVTSANDVVATA